jgi:hypothetical protein
LYWNDVLGNELTATEMISMWREHYAQDYTLAEWMRYEASIIYKHDPEFNAEDIDWGRLASGLRKDAGEE